MGQFHKVLKNKEFSKLVEMGRKGYFPLFSEALLRSLKQSDRLPCVEESLEIFKNISFQNSLERKKTLFDLLEESQKMVFAKTLIKVVEHTLLDEELTLH